MSAISDPVLVAIITSGLAAAAGVTSAWLSARARSTTSATRQENADQHAESASKLDQLTEAVHRNTGHVEGLRADVRELADRHDRLHAKFHRHLGHHHSDLEED